MKVVITSKGTTMEDAVDPRFGRCGTFLLAGTDSDEVRAVSNDAAALGGGAGVQAAQSVVDLGAEAVITGQLGPNSAQVLQAAGISVYVDASGSVQEALEAFKAGRLKEFRGDTQAMGRGTGAGRGRGMGGGRGRGPGQRKGGFAQGGS